MSNNQAVADDGLRFVGTINSITTGISQPMIAIMKAIVAQLKVIQNPPYPILNLLQLQKSLFSLLLSIMSSEANSQKSIPYFISRHIYAWNLNDWSIGWKTEVFV
jgi:hypothetical protein